MPYLAQCSLRGVTLDSGSQKGCKPINRWNVRHRMDPWIAIAAIVTIGLFGIAEGAISASTNHASDARKASHPYTAHILAIVFFIAFENSHMHLRRY